MGSLRGCIAGDAWPSSVRGLSCSLKGKRTQPSLPVTSVRRDCSLTGEEGEDDARSCPLMPRAALVIQWVLQRDAIPQGGANPNKSILSSDCGLQLAHMKSESLVIVNQHVTVNTFPSLVLTARQVRGVGSTRSSSLWRPTVNSITRTKS